jgi:hypothetical protein
MTEKTLRAWLTGNPQVIHTYGDRWVVTSEEADRIVEAYKATRA